MPPNKNADDLKKVVAVFSDDGRSKARAKKTVAAPDNTLIDVYTALRRQIDPLFEPHPNMLSHFSSLEAALRSASIGREHWSNYLAWVFAEFPRMTRGRVNIAPMNRLASLNLIDAFKASLPATRLNGKKAMELLKARGYAGSVSAAIDVAMAIRSKGSIPKCSAAAREAGQWLADNIALVGTEEIPG